MQRERDEKWFQNRFTPIMERIYFLLEAVFLARPADL